MSHSNNEMTKEQFLKAEVSVRRAYLANKNKKQLAKICKAYGVDVHGGAFAMAHALLALK